MDYYTDPTNAPEPAWCRNVNTSSSYLYPVPKRTCVNSEMAIVRQTMRHEVYPKLAITNRTWGPTPAGKQPLYRHQGVLLVPGISSTCTGSGADCDAVEDVIVQKLEQMFIWAKQDWLVGGFMPWHFGRWSRSLCVVSQPQRSGCTDDSTGPDPMGVPKHMPRVLAKLKEIGTYITKCGCGSDAQPYAVGVCWPEQF